KKEAKWPDGSVTTADGVFWVHTKREGAKTDALKEDGKFLVVGKVGDPAVEAKIQNPQRAVINLWAIIVVVAVTAVLVKGIQESAGFNALMVGIKLVAVLFVIVVGAFYINPENWTRDFAPYDWSGFSFFGAWTFGRVNAEGDPVGVLAG